MKVLPKGRQVRLEDSITISKPQFEKLTNEQLKEKIANYAKDLHFDYLPEKTGNVNHNTIGRTLNEVTPEEVHQIEIDHTNFLSFIDNLELPKEECQDQDRAGETELGDEDEEDVEENVQFCKDVLECWDEEPKIIGAEIMTRLKNPCVYMSVGRISSKLLKEMFELYVRIHDKPQK